MKTISKRRSPFSSSTKALLASLILGFFATPLTFAELRPDESLKFNYVTNDGSIYLDCERAILPTEPDFYRVKCGKAPGLVKVFDVRFRVRPLVLPPNRPVTEIVMWTTDRNTQRSYDHGSTVWVRLTRGSITDVTLHQDVENNYAALVARYSISVGRE